MKDEKIKNTVEVIIKELTDRKGFDHLWHEIDSDIQEEIKQVIYDIIESQPKKECGLPTESEIYIEAEKFAANFIKPLDLEIHERPAIKGNAMACFSAGFKKAMSIKVDDKDEEINRLKSEIEIHCNNVISIGHENMKLQEKESSEIEALKAEIKLYKNQFETARDLCKQQEAEIQELKDRMDAYAIDFYKFVHKNLKGVNFEFFDKVNDGKGSASPEKMYEIFKSELPLPPTKNK